MYFLECVPLSLKYLFDVCKTDGKDGHAAEEFIVMLGQVDGRQMGIFFVSITQVPALLRFQFG